MDQASNLRNLVNAESMQKRISNKKENGTSGSPRTVAVTSGKGGVGKTNIVSNLAMAFAALGKKVMIFDADLGLANVDIIFGIHPEYNIGHVLNGEKELSEVIVEGPKGIKIVPAGSGLSDLTHLTEGQKLNLLSEVETFDDEEDE